MKKVLIVHPVIAPYRLDLFNSLASRYRLRVTFLEESSASLGFNPRALLEHLKVEHATLRGGIRVRGRVLRWQLFREIREFDPDVIVSTEFSPTTLALAAMRRLGRLRASIIVWTDDNPSLVDADGRFRRLARRASMTAAGGYVVVSEEARVLYRQHFGVQVPVGVCPILREEGTFRGQLEQAKGDSARAVAQWNLSMRRVVLYVGRLAREKRIDRVLRAFATMSTMSAVLAIVGDGPERQALSELAAALGVSQRVLFVGRQEGSSLLAWYRLASVFVLASESEPFGAVINEALLSGVPVVCTDRAGARQLVDANRNGTVVDASKEQELSRAIEVWLDSGQNAGMLHAAPARESLMSVSFAHSVDAFAGVLDAAGTE